VILTVSRAAALNVEVLDSSGIQSGFEVVRYGSGYLATGKVGWLWVFGPEIYAWYATLPTGPWHQLRDVSGHALQIAPDLGLGDRLYYGGRLSTTLPGATVASPALVFSTNSIGCSAPSCTPQNDASQNVMLYGPHFARPTGLPSADALAAAYGGT